MTAINNPVVRGRMGDRSQIAPRADLRNAQESQPMNA